MTPPTLRRSPGTSTARRPPLRRTSRSTASTRSSTGDSVAVATSPTFRPLSAPARPPTWSASRWERSTSGRASTPSRSRQRSTAPTSGPVSTSTPLPGPAGSTSASPCPTSQATATVSDGGHPRTTWRSGQPSTTRPTSAASASNRSRGNRQRPQTATRTRTASRTAPPVPAGQPAAASGTAAARSDTSTSQRTGQPATHTSPSATGGTNAPTTTATRPRTVAGATAGAASRFAGSDTTLTVPDRPATIGAVASPAAALTASASATTDGQPRSRSRRDQPGASRTMAAVAVTDSAKPGSRASPGSWSRSRQTPALRAGTAARGRPDASASSVTAPMAAARRTLALGPARTTNPPSTSPATTACTLRSTTRRRSGHRTPVITIATFAPDTAVRCVRPARRKSSSSTGSMARVSPTTSPGSSPADLRSSTRPAEAASPSRRDPAARCSPLAGATGVGGARAETTATTSSPVRGSDTRRRVRTSSPGSRLVHSLPAANSRTGAWIRCDRGPSTSPVTVASAITRGWPAPANRCGSSSRWRTAVTPRPDSAKDRSGDASRAAARTAAHDVVTASAARMPRATVAALPLRLLSAATATAVAPAPPADAASAAGDR